MTVTFELRNNIVQCVIRIGDNRWRFSTRMKVNDGDWDDRRMRFRKNKVANEQLSKLYDTAFDVNDSLTRLGGVNIETFKKLMTLRMKGMQPKGETLVLPYFKKWVEEPRLSHKSDNRQLRTAYRKFEEYADKNIQFNDMTQKYIEGYIMHLEERGYSKNYIGSLLKNLKAVMNAAYADKLHDNLDFKRIPKMEEDSSAVYLTKEEIKMIEDYVPIGLDNKARDLFLLGYYTALRHSDFSRLSLSMIENNNFVLHQVKTDGKVIIPANPKAIKILKRYGGHAPKMNEVELNKRIKSIAYNAGIMDFAYPTKTRGGVRETGFCPKSEMVSTHTARRSGATNMYLEGIDIESIMRITGHKSYSSFRKYIRITDEEVANKLRNTEFFSG